MTTNARCIAILGAESTGKTTLADELAQALRAAGHGRVAVVHEVLREWCAQAGRTPLQHEQAGIAAEQHRRVAAAATCHDIVISDTTAVMTAVYSAFVFGDHSLDAAAAALHRGIHATLLTALDLPWVADGLQRDGPQVREPVDQAVRRLLMAQGLPFSVIGGSGPERLARALAALAPLLRAPLASEGMAAPGAHSTRGLFTRLQAPSAEAAPGDDVAGARAPDNNPAWACACCSVPEFERALMLRGSAEARAAAQFSAEEPGG